MTTDTRVLGVSNRALPTLTGDNTQSTLRLGRDGSQFVRPLGNMRSQLCAQGSYYYAQNATIDAATTLAGHAAPVLADLYTKAFLHLRNNAGSTSSALIHLDFIHIQVITAGANGTSDNWAAELDTGNTRVSSGGTALTQVNTNMQSSNTSDCTLLGGPVVLAAATTSQRKIGHGVFRPSIAITGDKYTFVFGGDNIVENNVVATAITHHIVPLPPVALGPSDQFALHLYAPSQSAAGVYKVSMGFWKE